MYAVIDIGSNTIRLSAYTIKDEMIKPMFSRKSMAGLINYVDKNGCMTERGVHKIVSVLQGFKKIIENTHVEHVFVLATASLRNVQNTKEVLEEIKDSTGFDVTVITGEEEGVCGFVGAAYNVNVDSGLLVDIGGGSTEFVFYQDKEIYKNCSIPVGSLSLYANFVSGLIPTREEYGKIKKYVKELLSEMKPNEVPASILCGVGGTTRAACKLVNDFYDLPLTNRSFQRDQLKKLMKSFYHEDEGIQRILRVVPDRIHTIIPGMILLRAITLFYGCEDIMVSEYGVREGYLIKTVIGWNNERKRF